jgi:hypothetical protein
MSKSLGFIFHVSRRTATGKSQNIGDFKTLPEAETAMLKHYTETPKRGKFEYVIAEEELEDIGGVIFRKFCMTLYVDGKRNYYKKYSAEELKNDK